MTDLSIVVVSWNTRDLVLACLDSVECALAGADATTRLAVETLVVDNGSSDGTTEAVFERFPGARRIRLPQNLGFAAGANAGIREASGRHLLLLNSDARVLPGALEESVRYLDAHPDVAIVGPQLLNPDGTRQNSIHNYPILATELLPKGIFQYLFRDRFPSRRWSGEDPIEVEAVAGAALFVRREAVEAVGPLSEDFFFFLEETDWCWRAREAGWRVVHLPTARVVHLLGGSSKRKSRGLTRIEYHRSLYRFYRKHHGAGRMAMVVFVRFGKALFYVATQGLLALVAPRIRSRFRMHRDVLAWHLRGCPDSVGLAALPVPDSEARGLEAGRPKWVG